MSESTQPLLQGVELTMRFGGVTALNAVDLAMAEGDHLGLIGPNGSGKTTLLNVLSGVYLATSGTLHLEGTELTNRRAAARARLGIVRTFQHPQLAASLTLLENVQIGERLGRRRGAGGSRMGTRSRELLELFGGAAYGHLLPEEAPYGAVKLAEVARAAAARPRILLLDEPAAGLSAEERQELVAALRRYRDSHPSLALCLVEHDVPLVSSVCDRLLVLNAGTAIVDGDPQVVLADSRVRDAYLGPQQLTTSSITGAPTKEHDS